LDHDNGTDERLLAIVEAPFLFLGVTHKPFVYNKEPICVMEEEGEEESTNN